MSIFTLFQRKISPVVIFFTCCVAIPLVLSACVSTRENLLDDQLSEVLKVRNIEPLYPGPDQDPKMVELGRSLFFEKEISGNRDVACATCHHPFAHTGDGLSLSIGEGGSGIATTRLIGAGHQFVPRNAPGLFNRGSPLWSTMFWDIRISLLPDSKFLTPAGDLLPEGLENVVAVQAMFPPTSQVEMRGFPGDVDIFGEANELALISGDDFTGIWSAIMERLLSFPEYQVMFTEAYPQIPLSSLGFEHAANAIAAFEIDAFTFLDSPWDQYLAGDKTALADKEKRGALLFYGEAGCSACHSGSLFSDQLPHNVAIPQLGPGKGDGPSGDLDFGRARETGDLDDIYSFRTPPLRNVALTGPWAHNGAFTSLESVVRHMLDPNSSLRNYDPTQLDPELASTYKAEMTEELLLYLDALAYPRSLSESQFQDLMAFLHALTSPSAVDIRQIVPDDTPSGLGVIN